LNLKKSTAAGFDFIMLSLFKNQKSLKKLQKQGADNYYPIQRSKDDVLLPYNVWEKYITGKISNNVDVQ